MDDAQFIVDSAIEKHQQMIKVALEYPNFLHARHSQRHYSSHAAAFQALNLIASHKLYNHGIVPLALWESRSSTLRSILFWTTCIRVNYQPLWSRMHNFQMRSRIFALSLSFMSQLTLEMKVVLSRFLGL